MARTPSRTPTPKSFQPPGDAGTYRDLLLFEERLKTNAARLQRRKRRYQMAWPLNHLLRLPPISLPGDVVLPTYITHSAFLVAVTTLVLFYASGLYAEKISYANRYVPHANRALRSFNMYLNTPQANHRGNPDFARGTRRTTPINPIPPSSNPRAFERKRGERDLADAAAAASARFWGWLPGARGKHPPSRKEVGAERADGGRTSQTPRSLTPVNKSPGSPSPGRTLRRPRSLSVEEGQGLKSQLGPRLPAMVANEGEECYSFLLGNAEDPVLIGS
ncbi:hypothetical protein BS47DRAFT_702065 [Hydnum rufescens UP504]|uniref:Transmembrane protein 188 n=1 Tax=Hydnum rufescens UP504 TaxID=1448309 RepID=A0A9P6B2B4_9AGAM|nr:hypothetical protein BS47DRAFT_702065 [Hydnum rufescens UP504]